MTLLKAFFLLLALPLATLALAHEAPACAAEARAQAEKLLAFHVGGDDRAEIDEEVTELEPLANPANEAQSFRVLEVWGFVYRAQYRMRFLYHTDADGGCLLMGQEILEHASL